MTYCMALCGYVAQANADQILDERPVPYLEHMDQS